MPRPAVLPKASISVRSADARPRRLRASLPRGNPLWSVPLSALTGTQERPIFSATNGRRRARMLPSGRGGQTAAAARPVEGPPPLMLVGAVVGEGDAIAIFVNRTDQKVVRLRQGKSLGGWSLTEVQPREVTLKQGDRSEVLALQRPDPAVSPRTRPPRRPIPRSS